MEHKQDVGHHDIAMGEDRKYHESEEGVSFFHDFVAGGVAGSASVVVGHPFDTLKVRQRIQKETGPPTIGHWPASTPQYEKRLLLTKCHVCRRCIYIHIYIYVIFRSDCKRRRQGYH